MSAQMVTPGSRVADVGCDHAHTSIWLIENGVAKSCIAMDLREGPLLHAAENIALCGCGNSIETRLSDGLDALAPGEADCILITGMGGSLTESILKAGKEVVEKASELVLQPQSDTGLVRKTVLDMGFNIDKEACCTEYGKFYLSIHAVKRKEQGGRGENACASGCSIRPYSESEIAYGRYLAETGDGVYYDHLCHEYRKVQIILDELEKGRKPEAKDRIKDFVREAGLLKETLEKYQEKEYMCGDTHKKESMENIITVTVKGQKKEYKKGVSLYEISRDFASEYPYDIILGSIDGRLRELNKTVTGNCRVDFLTIGDSDGHKTYVRGMILVMLRAFERELGDRKLHIKIQHSVGPALFCEVENGSVTPEEIAGAKAKMREMITEDIPFRKRSVSTAEAIELFAKKGMNDKEHLFKFRRTSRTNIYSFDGYEDYFYGYMPTSAGILKVFDLFPYQDGFMLLLPVAKKPNELPEFEDMPLFFNTLQVANRWGKMMGIENVSNLNEEITCGNSSDIILIQEALIEKRIGEIAEMIRDSGNKKFIMIAGPSSSGKTTFSHRLSIQLRTLGFKPHPIGLDDYFLNREDTPKDEDGNYNFECLEALDVEQFNKDMTALLNGEEVELPTFNFKAGKREYKGNKKKLGKDDILVIEGIHGLNEKMSYSLPSESKFKIYISALTELNIDDHNRIPTTDGRLLRRIVRDARTRGTSAKNTIAMWPSVRRGEEQNIFPYQEKADVIFNSAMIYELPVLKQFVEPLLFGIDESCPEFPEAKRLLKFLDYFLCMNTENIPKNSLIREFIGGSIFNV